MQARRSRDDNDDEVASGIRRKPAQRQQEQREETGVLGETGEEARARAHTVGLSEHCRTGQDDRRSFVSWRAATTAHDDAARRQAGSLRLQFRTSAPNINSNSWLRFERPSDAALVSPRLLTSREKSSWSANNRRRTSDETSRRESGVRRPSFSEVLLKRPAERANRRRRFGKR